MKTLHPLSQIKVGKNLEGELCTQVHQPNAEKQEGRKKKATPKSTILPHKPENHQHVKLKPEHGKAEQS